MALSRITKVGDGSTKTFTVSFALGYLNETDVTCRVGTEVDGGGNPVYRTITFVTDQIMTISGTAPANGVPIVFDRTIDKDDLLVSFTNGDILNESNLDIVQKQALMAVHEVLDGRFDKFSADLDMGTFKVRNLGAPVLGTDAARKDYVDQIITVSNDARDTATAKAVIATTQAGIATTKAAEAAASAAAAAASAVAAALFDPVHYWRDDRTVNYIGGSGGFGRIVINNMGQPDAVTNGTLANGVIVETEGTQGGLTVGAFGNTPSLQMRYATGTRLAPLGAKNNQTMFNNNIIGGYQVGGVGAFGWAGAASARNRVISAEDFTDIGRGAHWVWDTVAIGTTTISEKMRLAANGELLIGATVLPGATLDSKLHVAGKISADTLRMSGWSIEDYVTNGPSAVAINDKGYAGGTSQFRDFYLRDGKGGDIIIANGANKTASFTNTPLIRTFPTKQILQDVYQETAALASGAGNIPIDDTIPQSNEGNLTFTQAFTPKEAASKIEIEVQLAFAHSGSAGFTTAALFQDAGVNAIATSGGNYHGANESEVINWVFVVDAVSTAARTYTLRYGSSAGSVYLNGSAAAVRIYGGVLKSFIRIREIAS